MVVLVRAVSARTTGLWRPTCLFCSKTSKDSGGATRQVSHELTRIGTDSIELEALLRLFAAVCSERRRTNILGM